MEAEWMAKRAQLRELLHTRPDLTLKEQASYLGYSYGWAKKWKKRLVQAPPDDHDVLRSQPRRNHVEPYQWDPLVERRIEQMRLVPPKGLRRTPGPVTLLIYLPEDEELIAKGCRLPKSSRTVWNILKRLGLITRAPQISHEPLPLADPLEEVQMDFQDATTVERDWSIDGKVMHLVEVLNFVDRGTSILLSTQARSDFHAATALEAVIDFLREHGRPQRLSFDHDPRWVGGSSGWDFPSALIRFLWGVGVDVRITPVHQPWHNAFVERYVSKLGGRGPSVHCMKRDLLPSCFRYRSTLIFIHVIVIFGNKGSALPAPTTILGDEGQKPVGSAILRVIDGGWNDPLFQGEKAWLSKLQTAGGLDPRRQRKGWRCPVLPSIAGEIKPVPLCDGGLVYRTRSSDPARLLIKKLQCTLTTDVRRGRRLAVEAHHLPKVSPPILCREKEMRERTKGLSLKEQPPMLSIRKRQAQHVAALVGRQGKAPLLPSGAGVGCAIDPPLECQDQSHLL